MFSFWEFAISKLFVELLLDFKPFGTGNAVLDFGTIGFLNTLL